MLKLIISGGQTGADIAGLDAAKNNKIRTGGYAPTNWLTSDGSNPQLSAYGMIEFGTYKERTWENVKISQATIRLAYNFGTPGEICTLNAIKHYNKPYLDIDLKNPKPVDDVAHAIIDNWFQIINIAGNSEKTNPGTYKKAYTYLDILFNRIFFFCPF